MAVVSNKYPFRILHWLATIVGLVIFLLVPLGFYFISYQYTIGNLEAEAEINARIITQIIGKNPDMWQYENVRIEEYLSRRPSNYFSETRRIFDQNNNVILEKIDALRTPIVTRSSELFDSGVVVGRIEVSRSLQPLITKTLLLALCMLPLGIGAILILGIFPIRTIQRQVKTELDKERNTAKQYLDVAGVMLVALDSEYRITMINRKGCNILGYSPDELCNNFWLDCCVPSENRDETRELLSALGKSQPGMEAQIESPILTKDGQKKSIEWHHTVLFDTSGNFSGTLSSGENVTERKHLEAQLRHSQKMDAIGKLAGGVAHDFNNILSVIMGYCSLMQMHVADDDPQRLHIDQVIAATERASKLTRSLLVFSRKDVINPQNSDLNAIITNIGKFTRRIIGEDIELSVILNKVPLEVFVDIGQIEQVLMNLITNARDAMDKGGTLIIETSTLEMKAGFITAHGYGSEGKYALLTVSDSGRGMDENILKRIFEPFFTTKQAGKGTGLGLSIAYGIVKQHGGFINVYSEQEKGTTFKVYLPIVKTKGLTKKEPAETPLPKGGTETILVVEDDPSVRRLVESLLEKFGYHVILAEDGENALAVFAANQAKIQFVLMDIIMPRMNGRAAFDQIHARNPRLKVLFTSGYTSEFLLSRMEIDDGMDLLVKPFQPHDLLKRIREILDRRDLETPSEAISATHAQMDIS
jgi:two-component system cell cycle sensor histidine kinase/response regulator CckA